MFARFCMTAVAMFLSLGLHAADYARASPYERRQKMAEEKKSPDAAERSTPKTRAITVQLKELPDLSDEKTPLDEFCHRQREKLTEAYLTEVIESLRQEKQLEPVQVAKDERGKWQLLTGHRRIAALYLLAKQGVAGFSLGMHCSRDSRHRR